MKTTRRRRVFIGSGIIVAALCISSLLIFVSTQATASKLDSYSISDNTIPDEPIEFPVNENGYTYGVFTDSLIEPNLIAAEASNGKQGYVFQKDLRNADPSSNVKNPEEATAYTKEQEARSSDALCAAFANAVGEGVVTREQSDMFKKLCYSGTEEDGYASFRSYREAADKAGLPTSLTEEDLTDIVDEAIRAIAYYIPVYESDGETVVGEFMIGGLT